MVTESRWGHLRHISGKGVSTGMHLGGADWKNPTLPTTTVRIPSDWKCVFGFLFAFSWRRLGSPLQIARMRTLEASGKKRKPPGISLGHVGSVWDKTQYNITEIRFRPPFFVKISTRFDLVECSGSLWDHPGTPLAPDPEKPQKDLISRYICWVRFWHIVVLFWCLFFDVFCKPLSYQFFAPEAPTSLNFECLWAPFGAHLEQMWTSWNCDSVWDGTQKSSFGGLVFHLVSSFPCANCWDLLFSCFVWRFVTILQIRASIGSPFLTTFCNYFDHHFQARKK